MADRYWRGGTGSWTTTNTANWSTTSGGAGGASVPTSSDRVFFDQAGTYTVTMTGALNCAGITVSAGTVTFTSTGTLGINGSMSLIAGTLWSATGLITFNSTVAGNTILTNGVSLLCAVTIAGGEMNASAVWGEYTLQSSLTISGALTLTNGRFNTAGYAITTSNIVHTTGCYDFGSPSSTITTTGANVTAISLQTLLNASFNGRPNVIISGTGTQSISANGGMGTLTIAGGTNTSTVTISSGHYKDIIRTRTVAHTVAFGTTGNTLLMFEAWSLTGAAGAVVTVSGTIYLLSRPTGIGYLTSTLNCYGCPIYAGTTSTITSGYGVFASAYVAPVSPKYWVGGAGDWGNAAKWSTSSGGAGGAGKPWADEDVIFDANSGAPFTMSYTGTDGLNVAHKNFTCTPANITFYGGSSLTSHAITGNINSASNFTLGSNFSGAGVWGGTGPFTCNAPAFAPNNATAVWHFTQGVTFQRATSIQTAWLIYNGTFDFGGYAISCGAFFICSGDAKTWNLSTSTYTVPRQFIYAPFNTTISAASATINASGGTGGYTNAFLHSGALFDFGIGYTWGNFNTIAGSSDQYFAGLNCTVTCVNAAQKRDTGIAGGVTFNNCNILYWYRNFYTGSTSGTLYYTMAGAITFNGTTVFPTTVGFPAASTCTFTFNGPTTINLYANTAQTIFSGVTLICNAAVTMAFTSSNVAAANYTISSISTFNAGLTLSYPSNIVGSLTTVISATTIAGAFTINNASTTYGITVQFTANTTGTTTLTITTPSSSVRNAFVSSVSGTQRTISAAAVSLANTNFKDIFASGAAIPWTGTSLGDLGNNTNITFTAPKNVYWNLAGAQNWTANGWAATSGGVPSVSNTPLPQDTAVFDDAGAMGTVSISAATLIGSINASARTLPGTLSAATAQNLTYQYSVILGSGLADPTNITFISSSNATTFTSAGKTITGLTANSSVTLGGALTVSGNITVNSPATLSTAGYNVTLTAGGLIVNSGATLSAGSGASPTLTLNGTGTAISGTLSGSLFNVVVSATGASSIFRSSASQNTYGTFTFTNTTASATTAIGGGLFSSISRTGTAAQTIRFIPGYTFSTPNFNLTGSLGNVLTLNSSKTGTAASVDISSGSFSSTYLSVQDIAFTPAPAANGSTPYVLYAGATSTSLGNVTGLLFQDGGVGAVKAYLISATGATTWTVPSDWNSASNSIHLCGGGGGSSGSRFSTFNNKAGGGGGGGGYRVISNYSATPGASISAVVGAGGTAGGAGYLNGGTGGTTSWASGAYTATGGGGGAWFSTAYTYGGAGGVGTYTGGVGGAGGYTLSTYGITGGGGGGGAAGPSGNGGNGGNGLPYYSSTSTVDGGAGGGGGAGGVSTTNGADGVVGTTGTTGGAGGQGPNGTGSGAAGGGAGSLGGGGGGANYNGGTGGAGGVSTVILGSFGPAGGPGGISTSAGGTGVPGVWGAGASAGTPISNNATQQGGSAGGQGFIFIYYTPIAVATNYGGFFPFFS